MSDRTAPHPGVADTEMDREATEDSLKSDGFSATGMTKSDRLVEGLAIASGLSGVIVLIAFVLLLWWKGHGPTAEVDAAKTGQIGDFIGGVAGSLFALAAGLLFYLTLTLQRREFKNSLVELRLTRQALYKTAEHHEHTLAVMREEKEFNVCITAIKDLKADWEHLKIGLDRGTGLWIQTNHAWEQHYTPGHFFQHHGLHRQYSRDSNTYELTLLNYVVVADLVERTKWVVDSIANKDLATSERFYLAQLARPAVHDICSLMIPCFERVNKDITRLLADIARLSEHNTNSEVLNTHRSEYVVALLQKLQDAHVRLTSIKRAVQ